MALGNHFKGPVTGPFKTQWCNTSSKILTPHRLVVWLVGFFSAGSVSSVKREMNLYICRPVARQ
jgi:hypothetical protein